MSAALASAQGTNPKPSAEEYDVHAELGRLAIGAEYMVHSYSAGEQMFLAEKYLVVEVALYPPKGETVTPDLSKFQLRMNGRTMLTPHTAAMAAGSLRRPSWLQQQQPGMQGGIGQPQDRRLPAPPRAPNPDPPGGIEREKVSAEDVLMRTAFPEVARPGAVSGFVYFPYSGRPGSIRTLDLIFGDATLKLK
jgi:hypothetical protein